VLLGIITVELCSKHQTKHTLKQFKANLHTHKYQHKQNTNKNTKKRTQTNTRVFNLNLQDRIISINRLRHLKGFE